MGIHRVVRRHFYPLLVKGGEREGATLRRLRRYFCLSQAEVAVILNYEQTHISSLEVGRASMPEGLLMRAEDAFKDRRRIQ